MNTETDTHNRKLMFKDTGKDGRLQVKRSIPPSQPAEGTHPPC